MDSRAKNMFFDTIDGNIWYPRMYDMDTCYGLNNEGVLNFGYGLEQHDKDIYNGDFTINPKRIDNDLIGCNYCEFKDICFRREEDIVDIEKESNLDFLKNDIEIND